MEQKMEKLLNPEHDVDSALLMIADQCSEVVKRYEENDAPSDETIRGILQSYASDLHQQRETLSVQKDCILSEYHATVTRLAAQADEIEELKTHNQSLRRDLSHWKTQHSQSQNEREKLESKVGRLENEANGHIAELHKVQNSVQQWKADVNVLQAEMKTKDESIQQLLLSTKKTQELEAQIGIFDSEAMIAKEKLRKLWLENDSNITLKNGFRAAVLRNQAIAETQERRVAEMEYKVEQAEASLKEHQDNHGRDWTELEEQHMFELHDAQQHGLWYKEQWESACQQLIWKQEQSAEMKYIGASIGHLDVTVDNLDITVGGGFKELNMAVQKLLSDFNGAFDSLHGEQYLLAKLITDIQRSTKKAQRPSEHAQRHKGKSVDHSPLLGYSGGDEHVSNTGVEPIALTQSGFAKSILPGLASIENGACLNQDMLGLIVEGVNILHETGDSYLLTMVAGKETSDRVFKRIKTRQRLFDENTSARQRVVDTLESRGDLEIFQPQDHLVVTKRRRVSPDHTAETVDTSRDMVNVRGKRQRVLSTRHESDNLSILYKSTEGERTRSFRDQASSLMIPTMQDNEDPQILSKVMGGRLRDIEDGGPDGSVGQTDRQVALPLMSELDLRYQAQAFTQLPTKVDGLDNTKTKVEKIWSMFIPAWDITDTEVNTLKAQWKAIFARHNRSLDSVIEVVDMYIYGDANKEPPRPNVCLMAKVTTSVCGKGGSTMCANNCKYCKQGRTERRVCCWAEYVNGVTKGCNARRHDGTVEAGLRKWTRPENMVVEFHGKHVRWILRKRKLLVRDADQGLWLF